MANSRRDVFDYFMDCDSRVSITTGHLTDSGIVNKDYVVVHEACPRVLRDIISKFNLVSLHSDGLLIPLEPKKETKS